MAAEPSSQPIHLVSGQPAAGKTTYARELAGQLGAAPLESDEVTERLIRAGLELASRPGVMLVFHDVWFGPVVRKARLSACNTLKVPSQWNTHRCNHRLFQNVLYLQVRTS